MQLYVHVYYFPQTLEFVQLLGGPKSVYGYHSDTLNALILSLLPPTGFQYEERFKPSQIAFPNMKLYLLESLLQALQDNAGFHIPSVSAYIQVHLRVHYGREYRDYIKRNGKVKEMT